MSIQELKSLRLRKHKIENDKKARKYISEINKRYREITNKKKNNFFKNMNPFRRAAQILTEIQEIINKLKARSTTLYNTSLN